MTYAKDTISPTSIDDTGLTKREYFAAMAMQGLLSLPWDSDLPSLQLHHTIAALSIEHADLLIKELNKE